MLALASPPSVDSPVVEFLVKSSNQGSAKALCGAVPGLAPIRALAASGALAGHRRVHVYYGAKSPQHVPLSSALRAWSRDPRVE
ncbi:hypothetical protein H632_c4463p0, partial [Helicosporidium sp. ATCC 50920]